MFKKLLFAVAAFAAMATVAMPARACDEDCQKLAIGVGAFLYGRATAPQQYPAAGQYARPGYAPPRVVYVPATTVVVTGARHLPNGGCVQSNGRVGVVRDGMCFVAD